MLVKSGENCEREAEGPTQVRANKFQYIQVQGYANWQEEFELIVGTDGFYINCNHLEKDLSALVDNTGKTSAQCPAIVKTTNQMCSSILERNKE